MSELKVKVNLKPFVVPNYVVGVMPSRAGLVRSDDAPKWHLRDLDQQTLSDLCDKFRADVFEKAGHPDPIQLKERGFTLGGSE